MSGTFTYTNTQSRKRYDYLFESWDCGSNGGASSWSDFRFFNMATENTRTWADDYRPMPAVPFLSPTPYPKVWKNTTAAGLASRKTIQVNGVSCQYNTKADKHIELFDAFDHAYSTPLLSNTIDTNWQLPLRLKLKKLTVNLSSTVAEFDKTIDSFIDLSKGINGVYHYLRKRSNRQLRAIGWKPKRRRINLRDVSAAQLMASFELGPLMSDAFSTYLALQKKLEGDIWKRIVVKSDVSEDDSLNVIGPVDINRNGRKSQRAICYVLIDPEHAVNVGNPAEMLWERIPGSFIVDWAFNIGDILSSLDALRGVKRLVGTLTTRTYDTMSVDEGTQYLNDMVVTQANTMVGSSFERQTLTGLDIPQSSLIPSYKPSSSLRSLANGLALLHVIKTNDYNVLRRL